MARKVDLAAKAADLKKRSEKIVSGYARIDFTDGAGNFHKAGEFAELTQDEFDRTKRHRLLISKDRFEAQAKLDEIDARERARLSAELNGMDFADEDEAAEPTGAIATSTKGKASSKRASRKPSA